MKKMTVALLIFLCIALGGVFYWLRRQDDNIPPEIRFPDEMVLYQEGDDTDVLLEGVRAVDEVDGDVSDTLVVESVLPMQNGVSATVLYYAKDKSNNVAKVRRVVDYRSENSIDWTQEPETEARESETETETETEEPLPDGAPRITLTTDKVTVKQGEEYNLLSYVKSIRDDRDGDDWLYGQIHIDGRMNINGPGTYELYYSVVDREGNQSNRAKLTLVIE